MITEGAVPLKLVEMIVASVVTALVALMLAWLLPRLLKLYYRHYYLAKVPAIPFYDKHWLFGHYPSVVDRTEVLYRVPERYTREQHRTRRFEIGLFRPPAVMVSKEGRKVTTTHVLERAYLSFEKYLISWNKAMP